eukprot:gene13879-biopygen10430
MVCFPCLHTVRDPPDALSTGMMEGGSFSFEPIQTLLKLPADDANRALARFRPPRAGPGLIEVPALRTEQGLFFPICRKHPADPQLSRKL